MSEKRFFTKINKNGRLVIIDKECHIELIDLTLACEVLNRLDLKLKTYNEQLGEQQATINELQSIIDHIKCEENCFDYDYCCETVCSLYKEIKHLKEENEQLKNKLNEEYIKEHSI